MAILLYEEVGMQVKSHISACSTETNVHNKLIVGKWCLINLPDDVM